MTTQGAIASIMLTAEEYVVALGKTPNLIYVCARVVHIRQFLHKGQLRYRVGCQFTGRARFEQSTLRVVRVGDDSGKSEPATDQQAGGPAVPSVQKGNGHDG